MLHKTEEETQHGVSVKHSDSNSYLNVDSRCCSLKERRPAAAYKISEALFIEGISNYLLIIIKKSSFLCS